MEYIFFSLFALSFIVTLLVLRIWIKIAKREKLVVKDMNKFAHPLVPTFGGIAVLTGFLIGVLGYIALSVFYFKRVINLVEIFAILTTLLIISFIGMLDDFVCGWKKGFKKWQKPLLTLPAVLPLMAINAGVEMMHIPFFYAIHTGFIYPLVIIPIGVIGASQGFNMLAGLNGLESGMASIILFTLGYLAWQMGNPWIAIISCCAVFSLLAFLIYNKYPAKVFPGDVLRYPLGALIACIAIVGNLERAALILFIPYFIEFIIKAKHKFKSECFLIPNKDGNLEAPRIGSFTHLITRFLSKIKTKVYEYEIVFTLWVLEIILAIIVISI